MSSGSVASAGETASPAPPAKKPANTGRANLMEEIRRAGGFKGAGLHKADERARSPSPGQPGGGQEGSLSALLQDAFVKIKTAAAMSSDEEEDSSEENWSEEDC